MQKQKHSNDSRGLISRSYITYKEQQNKWLETF